MYFPSVFILIYCAAAGELISVCVESNMADPIVSASVDRHSLKIHCKRLTKVVHRAPWTRPYRNWHSLLLNDVFPFRVLTEPPLLHHFRAHFQLYVDALVHGSSCEDVACIALQLNRDLWNITDPPVLFEAAPPNQLNSYGVEETLSKKRGSCTAMSVFLVTALRMAGVPARLVGVPHWNLGLAKCPSGDASPSCGNHNWVEVFVAEKGWSFIDQRRLDQQVLPLNQSWFYPEWIQGVEAGGGNHSVFASSFMILNKLKDYPVGEGVQPADHFPMVWNWTNRQVAAWDVSLAYQTYSTDIKFITE